MSLTSTRPLRLSLPGSGLLSAIFSWQSLGAVLVAMMLARWVWVFAAPMEVALPATVSWKKSDAAQNLFGQSVEVDDSALAANSNYKLVGVFAHPKAGFAVLLVDGKQVGAGLGGEVSPGMRLVETSAKYVVLEQGGIRQRVELQEDDKAGSGIIPVSATGTNNLANPSVTAFDAGEMAKIPPDQRKAIRQELENFRRRK